MNYKGIIIGVFFIIVAILMVVIRWDYYGPTYINLKFWIIVIPILIVIFVIARPLIDKIIDKFIK